MNTIIYVHGICEHKQGYAKPWFEALQPHLKNEWDYKEVIWSDLVRFRKLNKGPETEVLYAELEATLLERATKENTLKAALGIPGLDCINDFLLYLTKADIRELVIERVIEVITDLKITDNINIISHSWGTVVAYEALNKLKEYTNDPYLIKNLFTVGSALSIKPVVNRLLFNKRPDNITNWYNFNAKDDIVGGKLSFEINNQYLDLTNMGCTDFVCSHSSYFLKDNVVVNKLFGDLLDD